MHGDGGFVHGCFTAISWTQRKIYEATGVTFTYDVHRRRVRHTHSRSVCAFMVHAKSEPHTATCGTAEEIRVDKMGKFKERLNAERD